MATLWESETASDADVTEKEIEFIQELISDDPSIGYDHWFELRGERAQQANSQDG
jgi:hypothetical protein